MEEMSPKLTLCWKKGTTVVVMTIEGNFWGVSTCVTGSRYVDRYEENKECSEKDYRERPMSKMW